MGWDWDCGLVLLVVDAVGAAVQRSAFFGVHPVKVTPQPVPPSIDNRTLHPVSYSAFNPRHFSVCVGGDGGEAAKRWLTVRPFLCFFLVLSTFSVVVETLGDRKPKWSMACDLKLTTLGDGKRFYQECLRLRSELCELQRSHEDLVMAVAKVSTTTATAAATVVTQL